MKWIMAAILAISGLALDVSSVEAAPRGRARGAAVRNRGVARNRPAVRRVAPVVRNRGRVSNAIRQRAGFGSRSIFATQFGVSESNVVIDAFGRVFIRRGGLLIRVR